MFAQHSLLRCSPQVVTDAKTNHVTSYHRQLSSPGARGRYVIVLPGRAYLSNLNPTWRHVTASYADVATCGTNSMPDSHCEIHGGSKQTNCHFSTAYRVFSTKISRFTGGGARLSTVFENFTEIFSLLQKLQLLQYSIPYFQCLLPYGQFLVDHFVVFWQQLMPLHQVVCRHSSLCSGATCSRLHDNHSLCCRDVRTLIAARL